MVLLLAVAGHADIHRTDLAEPTSDRCGNAGDVCRVVIRAPLDEALPPRGDGWQIGESRMPIAIGN